MTEQHPITLLPELVVQWADALSMHPDREVFTTIARWGADRELEACCALLVQQGFDFVEELRAARRPKPPSPKLQALKAISHLLDGAGRSADNANAAATIRRALEALPDD